MITRLAKIALLGGLVVYYALVVLNNLTDFNSNYQFVHHVLAMDTTFPGNHGMGRAITAPRLQLFFYFGIIAWEIVTTVLLGWGVTRLYRARRAASAVFDRAKDVALLALALSLLMWLVAFLAVGGEWFLMWQSRQWNGQEEAFRMFAVVGIVLLFVSQPERDTQP